MKITQLWDRHRSRRVAVIDAYPFGSNVRHRFTIHHPDLSAVNIRTVEAATRQWLRLLARYPKAELAVPSTVVDDMWSALVTDSDAYAALCQAAFGRTVGRPDPAVSRPEALLATLRRARQDEGPDTDDLPLLFRIDRDLAVPGGRRYLADCGGRGQCHELPGVACLEHLAGAGTPPRHHRHRLFRGGLTGPGVALYAKVHTTGTAQSGAGVDLGGGGTG
jgi:hypothetical protein